MSKKEIDVMVSVFKRNDDLASEINKNLSDKKVFTVNVLGAPGVGKTTTLINIIKRLNNKSYVIEGDVESNIDAVKLLEEGIDTIQINTSGSCHLSANHIEDAIGKMPVENGFLFIENIGNLICPADFVIGEHIKMLITCVTEGSDKPYKYPLAFEKADILLVNKCDLLDYVDFDENFFMEGVRKLNPFLPVFKVSAKTGDGFNNISKWLEAKAKEIVNI